MHKTCAIVGGTGRKERAGNEGGRAMAGADYGDIIYRNGVHQPLHSFLGDGRVKVYLSKRDFGIEVDGKVVDREQYVNPDDEDEFSGDIDGYRFQTRYADNAIDVELVEPDGTIWQARAGYEVGERFMDDGETPERFYRQLVRSRFHWTRIQS